MAVRSSEGAGDREPLFIPELAAFIADRAHGFDPAAWLPRGRRLTLPVLEATGDVPLDLAAYVGDRSAILVFYQGGWSRPCNEAMTMFQRAMPALAPHRVAVVAITPELPRHALAMSLRNQLTFALAIDHSCLFRKIARPRLQASARASPDRPRPRREAQGVERRGKLRPADADDDFLIDRERRVRWMSWGFATSDLDPDAVVAALRNLDGVDAK